MPGAAAINADLGDIGDNDACRYCHQRVPGGKIFQHETMCESRPKRNRNVMPPGANNKKPSQQPANKTSWRERSQMMQQAMAVAR